MGITEADIRLQGQWPLSDQVIAQTLENINQYQPRAIGLDIYRDVSQPPGSQELSAALQADNVIAITLYDTVPPPPSVPPERIGFSDLISDADNTIRRNLMFTEVNGEPLYSFSLQLSLRYLAEENLQLKILPNQDLQIADTVFPQIPANFGGYQLPKSEAQGTQILINYPSTAIAERVSLTDVLEGRLDPAQVKDRVVLIGTTAPSLKDLFPTPFSAKKTENHQMPGVLIHAQMVSQILGAVLDEQPLVWAWPQWGEILWLWVWCVVGGVLGWQFHHPFRLGIGTIAAFAGLWSICFFIFCQAGWVPFVAPALGLLSTLGIVLAYKSLYGIFYDSLTGLPNRSLFIQELGERSRRHQPQSSTAAVLFVDLDRFRLINQGLGHDVGDQLIVSTSQRLRSCLRPDMKLARVGGDEFAVMLPTLKHLGEAKAVADQIQRQLTQPFQIADHSIYSTVSIGIAYNQLADSMPGEDLLQDAQTAMYHAKVLGKAQHQVFARSMGLQARQRLEVETHLRQAIKNQEFQLYYQPIWSLDTETIFGFEALVRWQSPEQGLIMPDKFITVAEETGLIIPLGHWILQEACVQIQTWNQQFALLKPLIISINLSSHQFDQPDLVEHFESILMESGVDTACVKLEITESAIMSDVEEAIAVLNRLKSLGIQLSLDDFGIGYSSLSYLHCFPVDTLKIDRSFVNQMEEVRVNKEIVKAIVILAHNLGMSVVAEGIETEVQKNILKELKCEYGQGYVFSKPLPQDKATELIQQSLAK
ncbi:MAG: EAL domain-containing protein [Oscillatoriales cyanobacterium RM1_1_9]|nr:EAL domain-containing protein [Oscillatoriales cyanobacterium RM1_1_9]